MLMAGVSSTTACDPDDELGVVPGGVIVNESPLGLVPPPPPVGLGTPPEGVWGAGGLKTVTMAVTD